jgi:hypothetical protein
MEGWSEAIRMDFEYRILYAVGCLKKAQHALVLR